MMRKEKDFSFFFLFTLVLAVLINFCTILLGGLVISIFLPMLFWKKEYIGLNMSPSDDLSVALGWFLGNMIFYGLFFLFGDPVGKSFTVPIEAIPFLIVFQLLVYLSSIKFIKHNVRKKLKGTPV